MQPKSQTSAPAFFGVCLSTKPTAPPTVSFYRAEWFKPNDTVPKKKTTLIGVAYYFTIEDAKCTAVTEQSILDYTDKRTDEFHLVWVREENVPDSVGRQVKQLYADFDYAVCLSTNSNETPDVVVHHPVLFAPDDPGLMRPILDALAFYGACLSTGENGHPEVVFYRSIWRGTPSKNPLNGIAYYFQPNESGWKAVTNPIRDGTADFFLSNRTDETRRLAEVHLDWIREDNVPRSLIQQVAERFILDGLEEWPRNLNAWGLIDETACRESVCTDAIIGDRVFFLTRQSQDFFQTLTTVPDLLVLGANVILLKDQKLWRIDSVHRRQYGLQTLEKTSLTALVTRESGDKPVYLLSRKWIIEHCAEYAEELIKAIVYKMLKAELHLIGDAARSRISTDLHRFTYGGEFAKRDFNDCFQLSWLAQILEGLGRNNREGLGPEHRKVFYATVEENTTHADVKAICKNLKIIAGADENELFESYSGLIAALEEIFCDTKSQQESFVFLFEFLGKDFLVGLSPTELPAGSKGDIPQLNLAELNPVLVRTKHGDNYLGIFYKRVATIRARFSDYLIGDDFHLRVGEFLDDVRSQHLLDYDNDLLKDVLRARTPFHERRLLQMIGVPCRQALGDTFHGRMSAGMRPIGDQRTFQSRDEVVLDEVKKYQSLEKNLQAAKSLEECELLLSDKSVRYNLYGKMAILRKVATYHASLTGTVFRDVLSGFKAELEDQGHLLAAQLCNTVVGHAGRPNDNAVTKSETTEWVVAFWKEIMECFPDHGPDWSRFNERAHTRWDTEVREKSVYTLFVLSSMFDRQITAFYAPLGKFTMPYDPMVWAVNSVHRLQMLSAVLPMCCGDWVCTEKKGQNSGPNSRRLLWNYRLAALPKPANGLPNGGGRVPAPDADESFNCLGKACRHSQTGAALWSVGNSLHFDKVVLNRILQKMGWWFNGLLDESLHNHFRCRKCQSMLYPKIGDSYFSRFSCPEPADGHDRNVYLSWCMESSCDNIVDSRAGLEQCENGKYVCKCGACCRTHPKRAT